MEYIQEITLDLNLRNEIPVVIVKQGDASARGVLVHLKKDRIDYIPESGVSIMFRCEKPDGHGVITSSAEQDEELERYLVIDNGDGTVSVELIAQTTTACGRCRCDLCLYKDEQILSTLPFVLDVRRSPDVANLAVSTDDFRILTDRIQQAENLMKGVSQSIATLTLSTNWTGTASPYTQTIQVIGYDVNKYTKVDLLGDPTVINAMLASGTDEIMVINNNGMLVANAVGGKPTAQLVVQACVYDVLETS